MEINFSTMQAIADDAIAVCTTLGQPSQVTGTPDSYNYSFESAFIRISYFESPSQALWVAIPMSAIAEFKTHEFYQTFPAFLPEPIVHHNFLEVLWIESGEVKIYMPDAIHSTVFSWQQYLKGLLSLRAAFSNFN